MGKKKYIVVAVDYGEGVDGFPRVVFQGDSREKALEYLKDDLDRYGELLTDGYPETAEAMFDTANGKGSVFIEDGRFGCTWAVFEVDCEN